MYIAHARTPTITSTEQYQSFSNLQHSLRCNKLYEWVTPPAFWYLMNHFLNHHLIKQVNEFANLLASNKIASFCLHFSKR